MKKVWINHKVYELPLEGGIKGETSGICYHLKDEDVDWVVKLYYDTSWDEKVYPTLEELEVISRIHEQVMPVIVSEYPVFDSNEDYVGCAAPFIYESKGKTKKILYREPIENILDGLHKIQQVIPIFTKHRIVVNDWTIWNMRIGTIKDLKIGMYLFDDSFYEVSNLSDKMIEGLNQREFNNLIFTIIDDYFFRNGNIKYDSMEQQEFCDRFGKSKYSPLSLLENESRGYPNLETYLESAKEKQYRMN